MAKVQRKPPIFEALQFTGGTTNARAVIEGAAVVAPNYILRYQPAATEYGLEGGAIKEYKIPERIRVEAMLEQTITYVSVGFWLMVDRDGILSVISGTDYNAQFLPV